MLLQSFSTTELPQNNTHKASFSLFVFWFCGVFWVFFGVVTGASCWTDCEDIQSRFVFDETVYLFCDQFAAQNVFSKRRNEFVEEWKLLFFCFCQRSGEEGGKGGGSVCSPLSFVCWVPCHVVLSVIVDVCDDLQLVGNHKCLAAPQHCFETAPNLMNFHTFFLVWALVASAKTHKHLLLMTKHKDKQIVLERGNISDLFGTVFVKLINEMATFTEMTRRFPSVLLLIKTFPLHKILNCPIFLLLCFFKFVLFCFVWFIIFASKLTPLVSCLIVCLLLFVLLFCCSVVIVASLNLSTIFSTTKLSSPSSSLPIRLPNCCSFSGRMWVFGSPSEIFCDFVGEVWVGVVVGEKRRVSEKTVWGFWGEIDELVLRLSRHVGAVDVICERGRERSDGEGFTPDKHEDEFVFLEQLWFILLPCSFSSITFACGITWSGVRNCFMFSVTTSCRQPRKENQKTKLSQQQQEQEQETGNTHLSHHRNNFMHCTPQFTQQLKHDLIISSLSSANCGEDERVEFFHAGTVCFFVLFTNFWKKKNTDDTSHIKTHSPASLFVLKMEQVIRSIRTQPKQNKTKQNKIKQNKEKMWKRKLFFPFRTSISHFFLLKNKQQTETRKNRKKRVSPFWHLCCTKGKKNKHQQEKKGKKLKKQIERKTITEHSVILQQFDSPFLFFKCRLTRLLSRNRFPQVVTSKRSLVSVNQSVSCQSSFSSKTPIAAIMWTFERLLALLWMVTLLEMQTTCRSVSKGACSGIDLFLFVAVWDVFSLFEVAQEAGQRESTLVPLLLWLVVDQAKTWGNFVILERDAVESQKILWIACSQEKLGDRRKGQEQSVWEKEVQGSRQKQVASQNGFCVIGRMARRRMGKIVQACSDSALLLVHCCFVLSFFCVLFFCSFFCGKKRNSMEQKFGVLLCKIKLFFSITFFQLFSLFSVELRSFCHLFATRFCLRKPPCAEHEFESETVLRNQKNQRKQEKEKTGWFQHQKSCFFFVRVFVLQESFSPNKQKT